MTIEEGGAEPMLVVEESKHLKQLRRVLRKALDSTIQTMLDVEIEVSPVLRAVRTQLSSGGLEVAGTFDSTGLLWPFGGEDGGGIPLAPVRDAQTGDGTSTQAAHRGGYSCPPRAGTRPITRSRGTACVGRQVEVDEMCQQHQLNERFIELERLASQPPDEPTFR
jgi:hypothetical protein